MVVPDETVAESVAVVELVLDVVCALVEVDLKGVVAHAGSGMVEVASFEVVEAVVAE